MAEPIKDYIIALWPEGKPLFDPQMMEGLNNLAARKIWEQYTGNRPIAIDIEPIEWVLTCDPQVVETTQPGDGCPTCVAGNDQAMAYLKEHPGRYVALGNLTYTEHW